MFTLLPILLALVALPRLASAQDHASDVHWAGVVLNDLPAPFASSFCSDWVKTVVPTGTAAGYGGAQATITATTTVSPATCTGVVTVSSTTTITYTTTSTIVVAPTAPPAGYKRELEKRANWCPSIGRPCRLQPYDRPTVAEACAAFLGGQVVVTATVTGSTCGGYPAATPEGYPVETPVGYPTENESTITEGYPADFPTGYPNYDEYTGGDAVPQFEDY
jgi:hypothetical protein